MSIVSVVKCGGYEQEEIYAAVERAVALSGGIGAFVKPGQKVLLKPNLLKVAAPEEAAITHPEFIRAVIRLVKKQTTEIFLGDSPGGMVKADTVYEQCGLKELAAQENITLVKFDRIKHINGIPFAAIKDEVDVIISLPKFKTHNLTTLTGAVKNVFGLVPGLYKVHCHKLAPNFKVFSRALADIFGLAKPHLNIVDAVLAMHGEGPNRGDAYRLGLVVVSSDAVAADAVLARIIGLDPFTVISIAEAHKRGFGQADISRINVAGESIEAVKVKDFILPQIAWLFRLPNFLIRTILRFVPILMSVDEQECSRCGMCAQICPQKAITWRKGKLKVDCRKCILCLCCSETCPRNAIYMRFLHRRRKNEQ